jgi:hypothetical protein
MNQKDIQNATPTSNTQLQSQIPPSSSAHRLNKRNNTHQHTNLPPRSQPATARRRTAGRLLVLVHRRLKRQLARRIARLSKVRVGVNIVGDAGRPVGDVLCFGVAPVVAARVVGLDGAFAAGAVHLFDQGGVRDGDGAEQVGGLGVGAGEVGDVGAGAHGAGGAADCGGGGVSLGVSVVGGCEERQTLAVVK